MEERIFIFEPTALEAAWLRQNKDHPVAKLRRKLDKTAEKYRSLCAHGTDEQAIAVEGELEKLVAQYEKAWRR